MTEIYIPNAYSDGNWQDFQYPWPNSNQSQDMTFLKELADDVEAILEAATL